MSEVVVIYQSKYGAAKKYAEWIAEALGADLFERRKIAPEKMMEYDTVIYGGGIYAGGIAGISLIGKNYERIKGKNIILFTCGLANTKVEENVKHIREGMEKALPKELMKQAKLYHFRGYMDYSKLTSVHKLMMKMMNNMIVKKPENEKTSEDREFIATYGKAVDFTDQSSIGELVEHYKKYLKVNPN